MTNMELNSILKDLSYGKYNTDTNEIEILFRGKFIMSKPQKKIDSKSKQLYLEKIFKEFKTVRLNLNIPSDYSKYHGDFFLNLYNSVCIILREEKINSILELE
jgi:hypothetical protein